MPDLQQIGPYRIGERLGAGGLGTVYAADGPEGLVAVKVLHRACGDTLAAEVAAARRAAGPGVVRMLATDLTHEPPYLVMELVAAPDLHSRRRTGGTLAGSELERFATSLLTAMAHIHLAGIVHGDLKPTNVLVADDGTASVVDFGLATPVDPLAGTPGRGTPGWRAPEVEAGHRPTIASDVYGWGRLVAYAAGDAPLPPSLREKVDAALSAHLDHRRAVYVPPAFPDADPLPADADRGGALLDDVPETEPPLSIDSTSRGGTRVRRGLRGRTAAIGLAAAVVSGAAAIGIRGTHEPTAVAPGEIVVYDDAFRNGFRLNEFNGVNDDADTSEKHAGTRAIATTPGPYEGFLVWIPDGLPLDQVDVLRFWVLLPPGDQGELRVHFTRSTSQAVGRTEPLTGVVPGTWSEVTLRLDELIVDRSAFAAATDRMIWVNSAVPTARRTIYVDEITLGRDPH